MRRLVAAALLVVGCSSKGATDDRPWALPTWQFSETDNGNIIDIEGTLRGADVAYKVNTWSLRCIHERMECMIANVSEIGQDQLGSIQHYEQPVKEWNDTTIVLRDEENTTACALEVITINRVSKTVSYDALSRNADKDYCKAFHKPEDHHWTIGPPKQP